MRHRSATKHFNRDTEQRKSLFKNLLRALFEHGQIETTEPKAKALKGIADKLVHRAQQGTIPARRLLQRFFGTRAIVNRLVDEVAPAMKDRNSGYTRIVRLGKRRGDDSMMVKMELVVKPVAKTESKATKEAKATKEVKAPIKEAKPVEAKKVE
ncbi:50S ribosomal protein L17 [Candidatus Woesebacteria bacterium]|nr:50S ribosomal protein L17 [Candidatus Woesebacteria bacterium]